MNQPAGRTRRSEDGAYATGGAVRQDGTLPIYICNTCNREVVWATSQRTGGKYLVNISRGYLDQRFYAKANIHQCEIEAAYAGRSVEQRAMGDD